MDVRISREVEAAHEDEAELTAQAEVTQDMWPCSADDLFVVDVVQLTFEEEDEDDREDDDGND